MIDILHCCQTGFNIAIRRMERPIDLNEQMRSEQAHQDVCPECNPVLLAETLFGKEVIVNERTEK